jgi:choline kinase
MEAIRSKMAEFHQRLIMRAIILAAGRGSRLAEHNPGELPKCLLEFGGHSLLARHLDLLNRAGISQVEIVSGYEADRIIDHIGTLMLRPAVAFHFNPRYEQGSVISLWAAREALTAGHPVLVMDADVLYHPEILLRLVSTDIENCYLLDRKFEMGPEPVKIAVRDGRLVEVRKQLDESLDYDFLGESVGFFRFGPECARTIAEECARFDAEGLADAPHEEALRNILLAEPDSYGFEDVTGLPWIEIDFPEDVIRARDEILPAICADLDAF